MMHNGRNISLDDFASRNQLNKIIAENMINIPLLQEDEGSFEKKAYFCFYKAYKICYDLTFNGNPSKWKIPEYLIQCRYVSYNKDLVTIMQSVTMSIVVILLEHCNFPPSNPIVEVIGTINNAIRGMFIKGENDGFVSAEMIQSIRPTECIKVSRTIQRGTNIDCKIDINEFSFVSNKNVDEFFQIKIDDAVKKSLCEMSVFSTEVKNHTLHLNNVPKKEIDAKKTTSQKTGPDDNRQQQLADVQKTNKKLQDELKKLQDENSRLRSENEELQHRLAEKGDDKTEWIDWLDDVFHPSINAEAVAKTILDKKSPHLTDRCNYYVAFRVLSEIHWIPKPDKHAKAFLKWANAHFHCGWDWRKDDPFKFTDIDDNIKNTSIFEWDEKTMDTKMNGKYYRGVADSLMNAFVTLIDGKYYLDNNPYIKTGQPFVNNGKK